MHSCCMLTTCRIPPIISTTRNGTVKREAKILATQQHGEASITKTLAISFMAAAFAFSPLCSAPVMMEGPAYPDNSWDKLDSHLNFFSREVPYGISTTALSMPSRASLGQTLEIQKGAAIFRTSCIGCHDGGGNILQPGATLFSKDLERNGVSTEESIYEITYYGKGRMPGFGEKCTPRGQCTFGARLQDDEIKLLAMFVKSQAEQGWPNIEIYKD